MKPLKWGIVVVGVFAALCGTFYLFLNGLPRASAPIELSFLSMSNDLSGAQVALFSISNRTSKQITYVSDGTGRPCYSLTTMVVGPGSIMCTNHNPDGFLQAKAASLSPSSIVVFPVYVPRGVTGAVLEVSYEEDSHGLRERTRNLAQNYGMTIPARPSELKTVQVKQPFK